MPRTTSDYATPLAQNLDAIVAVDIGTTYTKVAYMIAHNNASKIKSEIVRSWPGSPVSRSGIVPTVLSYGRGDIPVTNFGFLAEKDQGVDMYRLFKPQFPTGLVYPEGDVWLAKGRTGRDLYFDFLQLIYPFIKDCVAESLVHVGLTWEDAKIQFNFSMPIERGENIMARLKSLSEAPAAAAHREDTGAALVQVARDAGFARQRNHLISDIVYNEAIASFTYSTQKMRSTLGLKKRDNILVVDIGGGTSDLCLLTVADREATEFKLGLVNPMIGEPLGFMKTKEQLSVILSQALGRHSPALDSPTVKRCVTELVKSTRSNEVFDHILKNGVLQEQKFELKYNPEWTKVPRPTTDDPDISITTMHIHLNTALYRKAVENVIVGNTETQLRGVRDQIDDFIEDLHDHGVAQPGTKRGKSKNKIHANLDVLVLSGGSGCTPLVLEMLERVLREDGQPGLDQIHDNISELRIITSDAPQMCVAYGVLELCHHQLKRDVHSTYWEDKIVIGLRRVLGLN